MIAPDRWLGVELRHLATLDAIVREGSFRGAADRLGYTQSAVSQHLTALERAVGTRLIERCRGRSPVGMTAAGELLAARAERVIAGVSATKSDLAALDAEQREPVPLGVLDAVAAGLVPHVIDAFADESPDVAVRTRESAADHALFALLRDGNLDLSFGEFPAPAGPFAGVEVLRVPWVLLVAASAVGRAADVSKLADVARLPLIGGHRGRARRRVEEQLRSPRVVFRSDSLERVLALVGAGVGSALVPRIGVDGDPRVAVICLQDPPPPLAVGLFWHAEAPLRPSAQALRDVIATRCSAAERARRPNAPARA